jgi:hypothetical protein
LHRFIEQWREGVPESLVVGVECGALHGFVLTFAATAFCAKRIFGEPASDAIQPPRQGVALTE